MKNEKIIEALGGIDPRYIAEAAEYSPASSGVRARQSRRRIALVAACAALLAVTVIFALPMMQRSTPESGEIELVGLWNDYLSGDGNKNNSEIKIDSLWLRNISTKGYESYEPCRTISDEYVGEKLGDVEVYNRLYHFDDATVSGEEYLDAEIFRIKGVDPDAALCLRYSEQGEALTTTHYYVFYNMGATYTDLDDLRDSLAAETYFSVGPYAIYATPDSSERANLTRYGLDETLAAELCEILLTIDGEGLESFDSTILTDCRSQLQIWVSSVLNGRNTFTEDGRIFSEIYIFDNGYLVYSSKNSWKAFRIDVDRAEEIFALVHRKGRLERQLQDFGGIYAKPE